MVEDLMKITDDIELVQQIIERYFEKYKIKGFE